MSDELKQGQMLTIKNPDSENIAEMLGLSNERFNKQRERLGHILVKDAATDVMLGIWNDLELTFEEKVFWTWSASKARAEAVMTMKSMLGMLGKHGV